MVIVQFCKGKASSPPDHGMSQNLEDRGTVQKFSERTDRNVSKVYQSVILLITQKVKKLSFNTSNPWSLKKI